MHKKVSFQFLLHKLYISFMNLKTTHKLIIIYLLIVLLPTTSLAAALYHSSYVSIQQSYYENEKNTLRGIKDNLIMQLNQISAMSYYFQQSDMLEPLLRGNYPNASETVYHYIEDVLPLIKATKLNTYVVSTNLYGFQSYYLNMSTPNGFSSVKLLDKDEDFILQLKHTKNGIWDFSLADKTPSLNYYKFLYSEKYPYDLGIVEITANLPALLSSLTNQTDHSLYINPSSTSSLLLYKNGSLTSSRYSLTNYTQYFSHYCNFKLDELNLSLIIPITGMQEVTKNSNYILLALLILSIAFSALYFLFSASFSSRLKAFNKHILSTKADNLTCFQTSDYKDEVGYAIRSYNRLVMKINQLINENYKIQLQSKDAEFYALQAQINPHFFYNIFENIRMCAEEHKDYDTARLIQIFGDYMRYNLNPNVSYIPLSDEMRSAQNYLKVHKILMGDSLVIDIGAYTDIDHVFCPRFVLQPLLENALKHGRKTSDKFKISLSVHDSVEYPDCVMVQISDNGIGIPPDKIIQLQESLNSSTLDSEHHVGLRNVNARIISYAGFPLAGLKIESQIKKNTIITFLLPRSKKQNTGLYNL